jgi:quercetin dioxygenase-like cupin family protein
MDRIDLSVLDNLTKILPEPDLTNISNVLIEDNSIVGKYLWKEKRVAVQLMSIPNGLAMPINKRDELEVLVIFDGALDVEMDNKTQLYKRGDVVKIPAGKGHICQAITNVKLIAISIPASEEYPDG